MRIVHWNVRKCVDPVSGACSRERVLRAVAELQPSVLTLNEVDMSATPSLVDDLAAAGLPHASFFGHVRDVYGNLLASAVPLRDVEHTHLDGGTSVRTRDGGVHRIHRGLLSAGLSVLGVDVRLALTHLDHISSTERCTQMRHALRTLDEGGGAAAQCLVVGDLNALRAADYTPAQWEAHEAYNAAQGWSAPADEAASGGVLALLAERRFVDAYAALEQPPQWRAPPWSAHVRDPARPRMRIDYVWSRPPPGGGRSLVPLAAHVSSSCGEASDHQPVVVDFEATAYDAGE